MSYFIYIYIKKEKRKESQFSWGLFFLIGKSSSGELYYTMPFSVALIGEKKNQKLRWGVLKGKEIRKGCHSRVGHSHGQNTWYTSMKFSGMNKILWELYKGSLDEFRVISPSYKASSHWGNNLCRDSKKKNVSEVIK